MMRILTNDDIARLLLAIEAMMDMVEGEALVSVCSLYTVIDAELHRRWRN